MFLQKDTPRPRVAWSALCHDVPFGTQHLMLSGLHTPREAEWLHAESSCASCVDATEEFKWPPLFDVAASPGSLPLWWSPTPCAVDRCALQNGDISSVPVEAIVRNLLVVASTCMINMHEITVHGHAVAPLVLDVCRSKATNAIASDTCTGRCC